MAVDWADSRHKMAERAGFEPAIPQRGIPVFETGAFNHSATSPYRTGPAERRSAEPVKQRWLTLIYCNRHHSRFVLGSW